MPKPLLSYLLGIATILALWGIWKLYERQVRRIPPWHPFELRSDLTLDDLVADGYRFSDMPCGMIHFSKSIGDTTIRYHVDINCEDYCGKYDPSVHSMMLDSAEIIPPPPDPEDTLLTNTPDRDDHSRKEEIEQDPYWPFDPREARRCYQRIYWRHYWFTMETIDSMAIRGFAERYGAFSHDEEWNCSTGGSFRVTNRNNKLSFICVIEPVDRYDSTSSKWQLRMIDNIPFLDHGRYEKYLKREEARRRYYGYE